MRRFAEFTNEYPWQWSPSDAEDFCTALRSGTQARALSTIRGYQAQLAPFCDYASDQRYGWVDLSGSCHQPS